MGSSLNTGNQGVLPPLGRSLLKVSLFLCCAIRSFAVQSWQDDCDHLPKTGIVTERPTPSSTLRERPSSVPEIDTATASSFEGSRPLDRSAKASLFVCSGDVTVSKSGSAEKVHLLLQTNVELAKPSTLADYIQFFETKDGQHRLYIKVPSSLKPKIEIEFPGDSSFDLILRSGNLRLGDSGGDKNIRIEEGQLEILGDIRQAYHYVALDLAKGQVKDCNHPRIAQKTANLWTVAGSGTHTLVADVVRGQIYLNPQLNGPEISCP